MSRFSISNGLPFTRPPQEGCKEPALLLGLRVTLVAFGVIGTVASSLTIARVPGFCQFSAIVGGVGLYLSLELAIVALFWRVVQRVAPPSQKADVDWALKQALENKDTDSVPMLCQALDSESRFTHFCQQCKDAPREPGSIQMIKDLIDIEDMKRRPQDFFKPWIDRTWNRNFEEFWELAEFLLDNGAQPFNSAFHQQIVEIQEGYFNKLAARNILFSPIPKESFDDSVFRNFVYYASKFDDLDRANENGDTPLHIAVKNNDKRSCEYLVTYGANPTLRNQKNISPLQEALEEEYSEILAAIFSALKPDQRFQYIKELIEELAQNQKIDRHPSLLEPYICAYTGEEALDDSQRKELLHLTLKCGMSSLSVKICHALDNLLAEEFLESAREGKLEGDLRKVCYEKDSHLYFETVATATIRGNASAVQHFLLADIRLGVNGVPSFGNLLHSAFILKHFSVAKVLLTERACDPDKAIALTFACMYSAPKEFITFLLESGHDPKIPMKVPTHPWGYTPLEWAAKSGNVEALQTLAQHDPSLLQTSETAISLAIHEQQLDSLHALRALGVDISYVGWKGNTYLHLVAQTPFISSMEKRLFLHECALGDGRDWRLNCNHARFCDYLTEQEFADYAPYFQTPSYMRTMTDIIPNVPGGVRELIFDSFTVKELAAATLVSKAWYRTLAPIIDQRRYAPKQLAPYSVEARELLNLSDTLIEVANNKKLSFDPQIAIERKSRYLLSLIRAGADPLKVGKDKEGGDVFFWELLSKEESIFIRKKFESEKYRWLPAWIPVGKVLSITLFTVVRFQSDHSESSLSTTAFLLSSFIQAGADPFRQEAEGRFFWQLFDRTTFEYCKKNFEEGGLTMITCWWPLFHPSIRLLTDAPSC